MAFTVKETALQLNCSIQAIYKKKNELVKSGLAYIDNKTNMFMITTEGLNYLKEHRIKYYTINKTEPIETHATDTEKELLERLIEEKEKQIKILTTQLEKLQQQNLELIINQRLMLPDPERKQSSFWARLFHGKEKE